MKKYSIENLAKVDSYVEEYFKDSDKHNQDFLINEISVEMLKTIIPKNIDDEELYLTYKIDLAISININANLKIPIIFDFENFEYFFQRYGEYN